MWAACVLCAWLTVGVMPDPIPLTPTLKALMAGIPVANALDLLTTQQAINRGGYEANPLLREPEYRYPLKLAATGLGMWGTRELAQRGHPTAAKTAAILSIVIPLLAAGWNLKQGR